MDRKSEIKSADFLYVNKVFSHETILWARLILWVRLILLKSEFMQEQKSALSQNDNCQYISLFCIGTDAQKYVIKGHLPFCTALLKLAKTHHFSPPFVQHKTPKSRGICLLSVSMYFSLFFLCFDM